MLVPVSCWLSHIRYVDTVLGVVTKPGTGGTMANTQRQLQNEPRRDQATVGRLTETEAHDILRNERRRAVLQIAYGSSGTIPVRDLSERIATEETGADPAPRSDRQSVYVSLIQTHLPKLDEAAVIDYDDQHKTIAPGPAADQLEPYITDRSQPADASASAVVSGRVFALVLVAAVVGWLSAAGSVVGVPVVSQLPPALWEFVALAATVGAVGYEQFL